MDGRQTELIKAFKNRKCNSTENEPEHAHKLQLLLLKVQKISDQIGSIMCRFKVQYIRPVSSLKLGMQSLDNLF